jgi:hypothetical protein
VKAAIYSRVSTLDQEPENQLREVRAYTAARGWTTAEYADHGSPGRSNVGPPWISSWPMPGVDGSTSWSAGASIGSVDR